MDGRTPPLSFRASRRRPGPVRSPHTTTPLRATRASVRRSPRLRTDDQSAVRRSLRISTAEGLVAELVGACASGGAITGWALYLGLTPVLVGVLGALPFAAQVVQVPSAWLTRVRGSRRTALWTIGVARQLPLVLVILPWLPVPETAQRTILLAVAAASSLLAVAGNNAWTSWMGELVPDRVRGRYFGRRTAFCALGSTLGALGAGLALDHARPGAGAGAVLSLLALASCAFGAITVALLRRQHEPRAHLVPPEPTLADALRPWTEPAARGALTFHIAWAAACGLAAAFYPIHMIANLRMGFACMALYNGAIAAVRMLTAPLWGRALDRVGARPVLVRAASGSASRQSSGCSLARTCSGRSRWTPSSAASCSPARGSRPSRCRSTSPRAGPGRSISPPSPPRRGSRRGWPRPPAARSRTSCRRTSGSWGARWSARSCSSSWEVGCGSAPPSSRCASSSPERARCRRWAASRWTAPSADSARRGSIRLAPCRSRSEARRRDLRLPALRRLLLQSRREPRRRVSQLRAGRARVAPAAKAAAPRPLHRVERARRAAPEAPRPGGAVRGAGGGAGPAPALRRLRGPPRRMPKGRGGKRPLPAVPRRARDHRLKVATLPGCSSSRTSATGSPERSACSKISRARFSAVGATSRTRNGSPSDRSGATSGSSRWSRSWWSSCSST